MIYLFDEKEKLVKIVNKKAVKTALQTYALTTDNYVSDRLTIETKALNDDDFEQVEYMAIQSMENNHQYHYFYIAQKKTVGDITTLTGVQSGIEELRKTPVFDKRPNNIRAEAVINDLLKNTNWRARFVAETINRSTNFYYISVFDALKKICKVWGLEMQFFVEMNGNGIGARYIDFKKRIGEATGKRVVYGHNALEILKEIERTNIYTALVGRGKGEQVSSAESSGKTADGYGRKITFENVVWSKAKGDPLDKPLGQRYLENPEMTRRYGIKNADGTMRAKIGFVDFNEEENPNELIKLTYQALVNASRPQLTLKTSSVYLKGVKIGDTIRVVRHDKKLDYDTRVFEITFNRLNNQSSDIKLGDQISESANSKIQSVADKAVEDFINNEFNSFVQKLPDFVKSADGYNTNWYSVEDPVKKYPKKVLINDIWYKPDPEHEGHTIMQRWTGEAWEEILRTYNEVSLQDKIDQKFNELKNTTDHAIAEANIRSAEALARARAGADLGREAKEIARENVGELNAFRTNVQIEREKLSDELKRYSREETTNQIIAIRERLSSDYVAKNTYVENVESTKQRFEVLTRDNEAKLAEFRQGIDGQLTTLSSQISESVADFQKVKETSLLYERILGKSEADAPDKISRLVMSSEIFQTEVGKYSTQGGPNMLRNSRADDGLKYWTEANNRLGFTSHGFYFNGQKRMFELRPGAVVKSPRFIVKRNADYRLNILGFDNNSKYLKIYFCKRKKGSTADFEEKQLIYDGKPKWTNGPVFDNEKTIKKSFQFNIGDFDDGYLQFEYDRNNPNKWGGLFMTELDFYEGTNDRKWQPAPEDSAEPIEAVRTQMTLLSDSWSIRNLNSAGDVLGQLNLNPDGSIRINEGLLSVGEKTIIKDGVIKKSMIGKAQIGTAHIDEIDASKANLINVTSKNVATEGLTANIIKGGKLSSLNGVTEFDLQTGWIEANGQNIGIRNRFPGRPLQYLTFGKGRIGDVDGSYTALLSNRNGVQKMDSTSAGIQIWNGRSNGKIASAITFYGQSMDFLLSGQENLRGVSIDIGRREINGLLDVYIRDKSLVDLFNVIDKNFKGIEDHLKRNGLGAPGYYRTYM
nr:MAG TPA: minor structural protein [Caudoviricetes sp.]